MRRLKNAHSKTTTHEHHGPSLPPNGDLCRFLRLLGALALQREGEAQPNQLDSDSNLLDFSGQRRAGSRLGELRDGRRSPASNAVSRTKESGWTDKKSGWPDSLSVSGNEKQARCLL